MKYRNKPIVREAVKFNGENFDELREFMGSLFFHPVHNRPLINTLEGDQLVSVGDYIIKGVKGEFYPCKPGIFEMTYEPADKPDPRDELIRVYEASIKGAVTYLKACGYEDVDMSEPEFQMLDDFKTALAQGAEIKKRMENDATN